MIRRSCARFRPVVAVACSSAPPWLEVVYQLARSRTISTTPDIRPMNSSACVLGRPGGSQVTHFGNVQRLSKHGSDSL